MTLSSAKFGFFKRKTMRLIAWIYLNWAILSHRLSSYESIKRKWLMPDPSGLIDIILAKQIRLSIIKANQLSPFKSNCLSQVMAASSLCRRYKLSYTIHIGVKKTGSTLKAHAWLTSDSFLICGDDDLVQYAAIDRLEE